MLKFQCLEERLLTGFGLVQTINHYITYSVITSQPALSYTSVVSTIRLHAVTSGEFEGSTFVQWTGNFSSDADAGESLSSPECFGLGC